MDVLHIVHEHQCSFRKTRDLWKVAHELCLGVKHMHEFVEDFT